MDRWGFQLFFKNVSAISFKNPRHSTEFNVEVKTEGISASFLLLFDVYWLCNCEFRKTHSIYQSLILCGYSLISFKSSLRGVVFSRLVLVWENSRVLLEIVCWINKGYLRERGILILKTCYLFLVFKQVYSLLTPLVVLAPRTLAILIAYDSCKETLAVLFQTLALLAVASFIVTLKSSFTHQL